MKFSHWKIRNLTNRKAYYVPIWRDRGAALDQVVDFMKSKGIPRTDCRIIETGGRFINLSFREYVLKEIHHAS